MLLHFFTQVGVRDTFEAQDFVDTLQQMAEEWQDRQLDKDALRLALRLVNLLNESLSELNTTLDEVNGLLVKN